MATMKPQLTDSGAGNSDGNCAVTGVGDEIGCVPPGRWSSPGVASSHATK